jgi:hypothetical protein
MQDRFIALVGPFECELLQVSKSLEFEPNEVNVYSLKLTNRS